MTANAWQPPGSPPVHILLTEDDDGHAELIQTLLTEVCPLNPIHRFRDGQELVDFLQDLPRQTEDGGRQRHLILLDIRMPRMDGPQALRIIKGNPALHRIPVIMLTTTDDPREIRKCYDLGCNFYVTKPVEFDKFTTVLRQLGLFLMIVHVPEAVSH